MCGIDDWSYGLSDFGMVFWVQPRMAMSIQVCHPGASGDELTTWAATVKFEFEECAQRNPNWRPWHGQVAVKRMFAAASVTYCRAELVRPRAVCTAPSRAQERGQRLRLARHAVRRGMGL